MKILWVNQSDVRQPRLFIEKSLKLVEKELLKKKAITKKQTELQLTLVFLNTEPAQQLNREYRQKNYATDVLSFASLDSESIGELVMCPQVLKRQSLENKHSYQLELLYMLIHGLLHLLGYDHETSAKEAKLMFAIQDNIFAKFLL